jgi:gamma-glutamyl:cysteine ligase YbdK (ATP-grasp superfamily)
MDEMAITKKPVKPTARTIETFISGAPDAPRRVRKGRKVQITLTITEPLLLRIDELATQIGQSRAAVINLAVLQMLQTGLRIEN